jgi:ubiquinol-cytochrome c reductase cytochrome c subunit
MRRFAVALAVLALAPPQGPPIVPAQRERDKPELQLGEELFAANCVRCHGIGGRGIRSNENPALRGPDLRDSGARAADFYLRTGSMPLADARDQPVRARVRFDEREVRSLIAYVGSLGDGPPVPAVRPGGVGTGRELFTEHCAGCHQVVAEGGILTGAKAPPLDRSSPIEIAEAVRIGPYVMPAFSERDISDAELDSLIAYVQYTKDPDDAGGWGISHLGPFPEGLVTWFGAMLVLVATCVAIGRRGVRR